MLPPRLYIKLHQSFFIAQRDSFNNNIMHIIYHKILFKIVSCVGIWLECDYFTIYAGSHTTYYGH